MNPAVVCTILSRLFFGAGLFLFFPVITALFYGEPFLPFCATMLVCFLLAFIAFKKGVPSVKDLNARECIAVISLTWLSVSFLYVLPYVFSGLLSPLDGLVESISGMTGTGATVFPDLRIVPKSLLLFRALTHWLGGLGIIVIFTALFPQFGKGSARMMDLESTSSSSARALPRIKETAKALFLVYLIFTAAATAVYICFGMTPFEALSHSLSTIPTGGFSPLNESIGAYDSPLLKMSVFFFMVISSANFSLYVLARQRGFSVILQDTEFKVYLGLVGGAGLLIAANLCTAGILPLPEALTEAFFYAGSTSSITGFSSSDYSVWPAFSQFILVILLLTGGCGGSTAGGLKVYRLILLVKSLYALLRQKLHPNEIFQVRMGKETFHAKELLHVFYYFFVYLGFIFLWTLLMTFTGLEIPDALGLSMTTMSNTGIIPTQLGSFPDLGQLPAGTKIIAACSMLMGRLECFTLLALCFPSFWRKTKW